MAEDFFETLGSEPDLKDPKGSIRRKYQTRLRNLAHTLDDFILHAENRLDAAVAGKIRKRAETEELLKHCKALRSAIPIKSFADEELPPEVYRNLCEIFGLDPDLPEDDST